MTSIRLNDCLGLMDLMLLSEDYGPRFTFNGAQCSVEKIDGHACFEAVAPNFGITVVYPGWYIRVHTEPAYIIIVGETHECIGWLTMPAFDKHTLIDHLSLSVTDETLCRLAV